MHGQVSPWAGVEYTQALSAVIRVWLLSRTQQIQSILTRHQLTSQRMAFIYLHKYLQKSTYCVPDTGYTFYNIISFNHLPLAVVGTFLNPIL